MNVKTLCLGILSFKESSGYEIKKEMEESFFSHFTDASYGSIYPALSQLAAQGYVAIRAEENSGKPDKKVYSITDLGRQTLAEWMCVVPPRDKYRSVFLFQMLLQDILPRHVVLTAIEKKISDIRNELFCMANCQLKDHSEGQKFVTDYGQTIFMAALPVLEKKRQELLAADAKLQETRKTA